MFVGKLWLDQREFLQLVLRSGQPFLVGFGPGEFGLDFLVLDDAALFQVDQQHAAGLQPPFAHDVLFAERQHARFRRHADQAIARDRKTRRAQPVAIERRADLAAIGKCHRRRAVPRLHQGGVVFIKCAAPGIHQRIARPGLGDQHHHRMRQAVPACHQQFERVVKAGGVGLAVRNDRPHLVEIGAEQFGFHRAAARVHPVDVATHGVDFAVVRDEPIRVRQFPAGKGVGRKPLMHQPQRRHAIGITQIVVKAADLGCQQQPLVDDRARRKAGHVQLADARQLMLFGQRVERVLGLLADRQQLAFERILIGRTIAAPHDALADHRHFGNHRRPQSLGRGRHIAPADQDLAFFGNELLEKFGDHAATGFILRQKAHCHGIIAGCRQRRARIMRPLAEQGIGQLDQDARAVAQQRIGTHRAAMVKIVQDFQGLFDDRVAFAALDMGNETHTTGVVFVTRIVKALNRRKSHLSNIPATRVGNARANHPAQKAMKVARKPPWLYESYFAMASAPGSPWGQAACTALRAKVDALQRWALILRKVASASRSARSPSSETGRVRPAPLSPVNREGNCTTGSVVIASGAWPSSGR